jgi:hypothetical protein
MKTVYLPFLQERPSSILVFENKNTVTLYVLYVLYKASGTYQNGKGKNKKKQLKTKIHQTMVCLEMHISIKKQSNG